MLTYFILFELFNLLDFISTSLLVIYGPLKEANPLMEFMINSFGIYGLLFAKGVVAILGYFVYVASQSAKSHYLRHVPLYIFLIYLPLTIWHSFLLYNVYLT